MLNDRYNIIKKVIISVCLLSMITLSGCGKSTQYEEKSALDIFDNTTIYFSNTEKEAKEELGKEKVYLDIKHSAEQLDVLNNRTHDSIRDLGGLDIVVDNNNAIMYVSSGIENRALDVYNTIITALKTEKSKYLTLYRSLEFDGNGNIINITFDSAEDKIKFDFTKTGGLVDTRFLDISIKTRDDIKEEDVNSLENELKILGWEDKTEETSKEAWNYLVFKNDAIYGTATSETGKQFMGLIKQLDGKELMIEDTGKVFQGISMESMLNSVVDKRKTNESIEKINTEIIKTTKSEDFENEVTIYYEEDTKNYKDDLNAIFESLGYKVNETDGYEDCDLIVGYTWLYNNSLQSSFDDTLNEAIMSHVNDSDTESTTEFIVRSSWILGR